MSNEEKQIVAASIQVLVERLNSEIAKARELGLKVLVTTGAFVEARPKISIKIWEENVFLKTSDCE